MTTGTDESTFTRACGALSEVLPRLTHILRSAPDPTARAVGSWTLAETAAHLSHVMEKDTASVQRRPMPDVELRPDAVAVLTKEMLDADVERDPRVLADRLAERGSTFTRLSPPDGTVTWIGGTRISAGAVACHLLLETLVHGHDVATAARAPWRIDPRHAALAIMGGVVPIMSASPESWIRPGRDPQARGRVEIRLRGHGRFALDLADTLSVETPPANPRADVHLLADPGVLLLVMLGRVAPIRALLTARLLAWGYRPAAAFTLLNNLTPP